MNLINLDDDTRAAMVDEIDFDLGPGPGTGSLYLSPRLSAQGLADYPDLLRAAALGGDPGSFAEALAVPGRLRLQELARNPRGGPDIVKAVPVNAPTLMAEGEFGRFYARGVCVRALAESGPDATVTVYRARESSKPRPESTLLENTTPSAAALLADLRTHVGVDTASGVPPGPNSGLNVHL